MTSSWASFLSVIVVILGLVNVSRMAGLMILGSWFDVEKLLKKPTVKSKYQPYVSVLIAAYNEASGIAKCLDSFAASQYSRFNIVVIDDGSKDGTSAVVKKWQKKHKQVKLKLLRKKNGGKAEALNYALKNMKLHPLVMTVDADSVMAATALGNAVAYFRNRQVVAVAANVQIMFHPSLLGVIQKIEYILGYQLKKAYTVINNEYIVGGIGATFRTHSLKKVGYYDTDTVTEDIDVTMKILSCGNKKQLVVYGDDVIANTQPVLSISDLYRQRFRWKLGRFQTLFKNKNLFFSVNHKHTKQLTWLQLPFVLWSEATFLLDPLMWGVLGWVIWQYQDFETLQSITWFMFFYSSLAIASEQTISTKTKLLLTAVAPLAWIFFLLISVVEYLGLLVCLLNPRKITHAKGRHAGSWHHVTRLSA